MSGPKDAANAALSAARRQNATLHGHDDARREIKDLCDRRAKGEPLAKYVSIVYDRDLQVFFGNTLAIACKE